MKAITSKAVFSTPGAGGCVVTNGKQFLAYPKGKTTKSLKALWFALTEDAVGEASKLGKGWKAVTW
ncbi:MAG: hypothetical protein WC677_07715 [Clostridia bacterium]